MEGLILFLFALSFFALSFCSPDNLAVSSPRAWAQSLGDRTALPIFLVSFHFESWAMGQGRPESREMARALNGSGFYRA